MERESNDELKSLAWLAFFAKQHGWDGLAERIAGDAERIQQRSSDRAATRKPEFPIADAESRDEAA